LNLRPSGYERVTIKNHNRAFYLHIVENKRFFGLPSFMYFPPFKALLDDFGYDLVTLICYSELIDFSSGLSFRAANYF